MDPRPSIDQLKSGDPQAWTWLLDTFGGQIAGYARRMGCPDAEDVAGSTLEAVARGIGNFYGSHSQLRSWVFSIAHARVVDDLRRRNRRPEIGEAEVEALDQVGEEPAMSEVIGDPQLASAMGQLTEDQRALLHLRYVVDLPIKEIARATGKSEVATRVAVHRASRRLRDLLGSPQYVEADVA
jgi:RNA polymerase sigma factor (sigma-70 family)